MSSSQKSTLFKSTLISPLASLTALASLASLLSLVWLGLPVAAASPQTGGPSGQLGQTSQNAQLVQSVPLETSLAQPGIPFTADVWIEMIRGARSSIDLAQFYLSNGKAPEKDEEKTTKKTSAKPLEPILHELEKAASRGVKIRLLLASSLLSEDPATLERFKRMRGSWVRTLDMSKISGGVHHAKYWIVDKKDVFIGSQNFDWRSLNQIQELGVRVKETDIAKRLGRVFDADWKLAKGGEDPALGYYSAGNSSHPAIELVASPKRLNPNDVRNSVEALVELITGAQKSVQVQLMDYAPLSGNQTYWPELDNALRTAAIRGVKVQLLLSDSPSALRAMDYLKSLSILPGVTIRVMSIPEYSGGAIPYARLVHSKFMVVDTTALWLGSSNWSKGYFYNSRNVDLVLRQADQAQLASQVFQKTWESMYANDVSQFTAAGKIKAPETNPDSELKQLSKHPDQKL